jgi:hypothetical protein
MGGKAPVNTLLRTMPFVVLLVAATAAAQDNRLTEAEKEAGWRLLFDGKTTEGWRGYKMKKLPPGWRVIDGALVRVSGNVLALRHAKTSRSPKSGIPGPG